MRRSSLAMFLLMVVILVVSVVRAMTVEFDDDEFQHAHMAWLIAHGQTPYVDFFEHHTPVYHLFVAPLFVFASGVSAIFVLRLISVLCLVGTLAGVFRVASAVAGRWAGFYATGLLFCAPFFLGKMIEVRPEVPAMLCFAWSAAFLVWRRSCRLVSWSRMAASGALAGLGVWLSVKFAPIGAGLCLCALLMHGWRALMPFAVGSIVVAIPAVLWLAGLGAFPAFVDSVFVNNLGWQHRFSAADYAIQAFGQCGPLLTMGVTGLLGGLVRAGLRRRALCGVLLGGAGLLVIVVVPEPFRQSFLPLLMLLAGSAGVFISTIRFALHGARGAGVALVMLAFASVSPGLYAMWHDRGKTNDTDLHLMKAVESLDPLSGQVFDGRGLMFYRPHVGRHACMHKGILMMLDPDAYAKGVIRALESAGYPTVIADYRVEQMPQAILTFIADRYLPMPDSPIRVAGLRFDRAVLPAGLRAQVLVSGLYRATWRGGSVEVDGVATGNGSLVKLIAGEHHFKGKGFVDGFELRLENRQ